MSFASPLWLVLLLPLLAAAFWLLKGGNATAVGLPGAWSRVVQSQMLPRMANRVEGRRTGAVPVGLLVLALLVLALSRPAIGTSDPGAYENLIGRAIVLDMSGAADVTEQRLVVSKLFDAAPMIPTLLIAVSSDGYEVVPLTRDVGFLERYLQVLAPSTMPDEGRDLQLGVARAQAALSRTGTITGQIILVTGGLPPSVGLVPGQMDLRGAVIPVGPTQGDWDETARTLGLDLVLPEYAPTLNTDIVRRAEKILHDLPRNGLLNLAPFLVAAVGLCWLGFFRRRVVA